MLKTEAAVIRRRWTRVEARIIIFECEFATVTTSLMGKYLGAFWMLRPVLRHLFIFHRLWVRCKTRKYVVSRFPLCYSDPLTSVFYW